MSKAQKNQGKASGGSATQATSQLLRGLLMLRTVIDAPAPLSLAELAELTSLDPSTALRIAQVLITDGYLVRHEVGKRYAAGPRAISMLSPYHSINVFRRETAEILQQVRDITGATTAVVLFLGAERLILEVAQGREALAPFFDTWLRTPLHAAASGKLLLASMGPKQKRALLGPDPLPATTPQTITSLAALEQELDQVRANGYAVARDELMTGLTAVAAPIERGGTTIGCTVSVCSTARLPDPAMSDLGIKLHDTARLIASAALSVRALTHYIGA